MESKSFKIATAFQHWTQSKPVPRASPIDEFVVLKIIME
jgi:hypothetical protein